MDLFQFNVAPLASAYAGDKPIVRMFEPSDLSEDQASVYTNLLDWYDDPNGRQYIKLGGYAGTGKTTLIAAFARELENGGEDVAFTAFTGKAVNVMSRKLRAAGIRGQCSTLHSLMYRPKANSKGEVEGWEKVEALPCSMIVVDEASMVGRELWEDLVSYGLPIIAVGDHGQLPPVGDQVVNLMTNPDLRLERIHRQAAGNPILELAQWVREGNSHLKYTPKDERVSFVPSFASIADKVAANPDNFVALCYTNRTRVALNNFVRRALKQSSQMPNINGNYPSVGDTVVCLRNRKPIFNGMRGKLSVVDLQPDTYNNIGGVVDFVDDNLQLTARMHVPQFCNPKTIDKLENVIFKDGQTAHSWNQVGMLFDYGYALTCHKSQGSQFSDVVIVWENLFRDMDMRNRWMYTAVTRAAERLWIVRA